MGWQCSSFARIGAETHHTPPPPDESTIFLPNSVLCFQHKLKTKAKFQPPEAALKPTQSKCNNVTRCNAKSRNGSWLQASGLPPAKLRRPPERWPASQDWLPPQEPSPRAKKLMDGSTIRGPIVFNKLGFVCSKHGGPHPPATAPKSKGPAGRTQPGLESCGSTHTKRGGVTSATLPSSRCPAPAHSAPPVRPPIGPPASPRPNPATRRSASQSAGEGWRERLPGGLSVRLP